MFVRILAFIGFCLFKSLPPAVAVVAAAIVNPLNVVTATDRASQDVFFRYIAPLYGREHRPITVIMLDDHFVETVGSGWPVSHRTMTRFLQTLYCYQPKSVFFDLLFTHEHSAERQTEQFIDYLKGDAKLHDRIVGQCARTFVDRERFADDPDGYDAAVEEASVALRRRLFPLPDVFIGDLAPQKDFPVDGGSAVFDAMRDPGIRRLPTNWIADDGAYPLVITLDEEAAFDETPALSLDDIWPGDVDGKVPSAALTLYANLTTEEGENPEQRLAELISQEQHELIVEWGFYPRHLPNEALTPEEMTSDRAGHRDPGMTAEFLRIRQFPDGCHTRPDDITPSFLEGMPGVDQAIQSLSPLKESVWQFLLDTVGLLNTSPDQPRQTCPYNQWVPGEAVLFASSAAQQETLRALFQDRVVMIGADIKGAPDLVQSPVHGQTPGVFLHAMALDNLLEYGLDGYWRPMPTLPQYPDSPVIVSKISVGTAIELALVWVLLGFSTFVSHLRDRLGERWSEAVYTGVELLGHMTLVFGTVAVLAAYAIAPMNWIGLTVLAVSKDILGRFELPKIGAGSIVRLRSKFTP